MEGGIFAHVDLATIILTAVFGILFPALCIGAWRIAGRTRILEEQHTVIQRDVVKLESGMTKLTVLPGDFKRLDERCMLRCDQEHEARRLNTADHREIKQTQRDDKKELFAALDKMKKELISEFRKSNGGVG